ncbi:MAG: leucine-rich repeat domain-containing protein [Gammaproteobacteria bacterium]|nr:leucine-rich repeat domain-containing protein [Gammaproteobacteria bacterium]
MSVESRTTADHSPDRIRFATVLAWTCFAAATATTAVHGQEADIPDENLRAAIAATLGKLPGAAITVAELESLTVLRASRDDIEELTGLEHATGLVELHLGFNDIADASPLAHLTALTTLDLSDNKISDLEPLSGLRSLASLRLSNNRISTPSPLAGLPLLTDLRLSGNGVSDLAPLAGMTSLGRLDLSNNGISDVSPLSGLTALNSLDLSQNGIADVSPLSGMTSLAILHLSANGISGLSPLAGLTALGVLGLSNNRVSDVSPLAGMASLWSLGLADNRISDVSPLSGLTSLELLLLSRNGISDLSPLAGMGELEWLDLSHNAISNLMPLAKLGGLEFLDLSHNAISGLSPLGALGELEILDLSDNAIADLSPLSGLRELDALDLSRNRVSSLSSLSRLRLLVLDLSGNRISDLSPLTSLTLISLDLAGNEIRDSSPLSGLLFLLDLDLSGNQITDLAPLPPLLVSLDLSHNQVRDLSRARGLLLRALNLSDNGISDLSSLGDAPFLRQLDLSNNRVADLSALKKTEGVELLDIVANEVVDLTPAAQLSSLRSLYVGGNAVADVMPLASEPLLLRDVSLWRNPLDDVSLEVHIPAMNQRGVGMTGGGWRVPLFPSPDGFRQGFVRVVSSVAGESLPEDASDNAWVYASGRNTGPVRVLLGARRARHYNANDLVAGNPDKGIRSTIGASDRLDVYASGDVDVLSYIRTADGFVTSMHDTAPWLPDGMRLDRLRGRAVSASGRASGGHFVPIFNPASNAKQRSMLRLVNAGDEDAEVTVHAVDDHGVAAAPVRLALAAHSTRTLSAADLESGEPADLSGSLGDGEGKWRLVVSADAEIHVMNLMSSPTGHLTNLSTSSDADLVVPMFPAASHPTRQGFVRVANLGATAGTAEVRGYDDEGTSHGPVTLELPAGRTVHFNSDDWESGNEDKGLEGAAGEGEGAWRLEFESELDLVVSAYVRTSDGFLTSMHDLVDRNACAAEAAESGPVPARSPRSFAFRPCRDESRVPFFNPASNTRQVSSLRLVNLGDADAAVAILGVDDDGAQRGPARLSLPGGAAWNLTSQQLESGDADGLAGALGDGTGKWELRVHVADEAAGDVMVMSLLESPTGHLTNLSTWPDDELRTR